MAQAGENVGCLVLGEFVDDASARLQAKSVEERGKAECLHELVRRLAGEVGVPQARLEDVVARVMAILGPQIEERVREELQKSLRPEQRSEGDGVVG
jgi:hypothetical protein